MQPGDSTGVEHRTPPLDMASDHEPLANVEGLNLYTALDNNPINAVNPLGE